MLLLATDDTASFRGFFRLLSEQHIPFVVSENLRWMDDPSRRFDLVIVPGRAPQALERTCVTADGCWSRGQRHPRCPSAALSAAGPTQGYWRVHDHNQLPSLGDTNLIFIDGEYVELAPIDRPLLTLIPAAMFGPPEKVWSDKVETKVPGLVFADHGKGRVAYIPWNVGALYYRHSSQGHAGLMTDVIDRLLPAGRQLATDAHPLVEMTVMDQPARRRTLVHLVNGTGHQGTAYFRRWSCGTSESSSRDVRRVRAVDLDRDLPIRPAAPCGPSRSRA